jgi:hypothetical protein
VGILEVTRSEMSRIPDGGRLCGRRLLVEWFVECELSE